MMGTPRDKPVRNMIITKMKSPQIAKPLQFYTNLNSPNKVQGNLLCAVHCINQILSFMSCADYNVSG